MPRRSRPRPYQIVLHIGNWTRSMRYETLDKAIKEARRHAYYGKLRAQVWYGYTPYRYSALHEGHLSRDFYGEHANAFPPRLLITFKPK